MLALSLDSQDNIRWIANGRRGERDVVPLTLWPIWRPQRLTHRPARGRPSASLMSRSRRCHRVRKMVSRGLMCHTQRGRCKGVSLPIWQCLSKWRAFTNLTPCTEGWERQGVIDVRLTEKWAEFVSHTHTHTLNNKQWHWANTSLCIWLTEKGTSQKRSHFEQLKLKQLPF